MFDIGAMELILVGVVALLVVGPERLPKLARTAGLWVGHARRALVSVKAEIDREVKAEELKEILRKQAENNPLESIIEDTGDLRPKVSSGASGGAGSTPRAAVSPAPGASSANTSVDRVAQSGGTPE
jgi:sec-independent protein translocase protein TatB